MIRSAQQKGTVLLFAVILLVVSSSGAAMAELAKIADNVYARVDIRQSTPKNSFGANAGIIIGRDGVAVIDTLMTAKEAKGFLADIRKITDKPIKYVVNTHYHPDHTFGNGVFADAGAIVISHKIGKMDQESKSEPALKSAASFGLTEDDTAGTKLSYPVIAFDGTMQIDLGGVKIELIPMLDTHSSDSLLVYVPQAKAAFSGDILFTGYHPFLGEGNIENWARALDEIATMDIEKIIPGHGPVSSKKDLAEMKDYLILFDRKAKELSAKSNDPEAIAKEIVKSLPQRPEGAGLILWNINAKYLKK